MMSFCFRRKGCVGLLGAGFRGFCSHIQARVPVIPNQSTFKIKSSLTLQSPAKTSEVCQNVSPMLETNTSDCTSLTQSSTPTQSILQTKNEKLLFKVWSVEPELEKLAFFPRIKGVYWLLRLSEHIWGSWGSIFFLNSAIRWTVLYNYQYRVWWR